MVQGQQRLAFLGVEKDGQSIVFPQRDIKLSHDGYSFDNDTALVYPAAYRVEAESGEHKLNFTVDVLQAGSEILDFKPPQPSPIISQQISMLQGRLESKSGEVYEFQKEGLSTFAAARLHPIFGRIEGYNLTSANSTLTLSAVNERTGQLKTASIASVGLFSLDAIFADYQADPAAPWIAEGDRINLELREETGEGKDRRGEEGNASNLLDSANLIINLSQDSQEINFTAQNPPL
jgi:hypothetical protein